MAKNISYFLLKLLISTFAVFITAWLLPGVEVNMFTTAILVAMVLAFLNAILKPILVFLTIPVTILSLGLFLLVINAFIIQIAGYFVPGFHVASFWWAFLFGIILSIVTSILEIPTRQNPNKP
jgi:putative membrane protein